MAATPIIVPADLGALIQRARVRGGLTQQQLAEHMGISRRYVSEMESGKPGLYTSRLFDLLTELGIRLHGEIAP